MYFWRIGSRQFQSFFLLLKLFLTVKCINGNPFYCRLLHIVCLFISTLPLLLTSLTVSQQLNLKQRTYPTNLKNLIILSVSNGTLLFFSQFYVWMTFIIRLMTEFYVTRNEHFNSSSLSFQGNSQLGHNNSVGFNQTPPFIAGISKYWDESRSGNEVCTVHTCY